MLKYVVATLAVAVLAYWMSDAPDGEFTQPWKTKLIAKMMGVVLRVGGVFEYLGLGTDVNITRRILESNYHMSVEDDPALQITEADIAGVHVRMYVPRPAPDAPLPALIYYHGGGWVVGSVNTVDDITRRLSKSLSAVVISVEYRMAPEVTFPVPLDDCTAVTKYVLQHAKEFNVDPARVAIGGDSAGGNLAAAVSLRLRDEKVQPQVKLQLLIYPALQPLTFLNPSFQQNAHGPLLTRDKTAYFWAMYIQGKPDNVEAFLTNRHIPYNTKSVPALKYLDNDKLPAEFLAKPFVYKSHTADHDKDIWKQIQGDVINPYLAPLLAEDLSDLPEAYVITCHLDVLRDEGFWYADRLKEAGNHVTYKHYRNAFHGMLNVHAGPMELKEGNDMMLDLIDFIKKTL